MTLVSSANNIGSYIEFILRGRAFIYIMTNRDLEFVHGDLHVSMYPSRRKRNVIFSGDVTLEHEPSFLYSSNSTDTEKKIKCAN